MKSKKLSTVLTIIIALCAVVAVIFVVGALKKDNPNGEDTLMIDGYAVSDDYIDSYVTETKFIGGIGYPEVYKEPFQKSDYYISNKELWETHADIIEPAMNHAKEFADALINLTYRDILEDPEGSVGGIMSYMDSDWLVYEDTDDEESMRDYIEECLEDYVENETVITGEFITDTSLVYEDAFLYVRGMVEFEDFSTQAENSDPQVCMMEIIMHRSSNDPHKFEVVDWYQMEYGKDE